MTFDLDEEEIRQNSFRTWLQAKGYSDNTRKAYVSSVNKIGKNYQSSSGTIFHIWACSINEISKLNVILKTLPDDDYATKKNAVKRYIEFLTDYFKSQGVLAHSNLQDIDISQSVSNELLQNLILQQFERLFPSYKISKEAQRPNTIILESESEKKALVIMIDATGANNQKMFFDLSSILKELKELFAEKQILVKGLIITGKDDGGKLVSACAICGIEVKTYSLNLQLTELC